MALGIFNLCCSMWDLVSQLGIEPGAPSPTHWTTREIPAHISKMQRTRWGFWSSGQDANAGFPMHVPGFDPWSAI